MNALRRLTLTETIRRGFLQGTVAPPCKVCRNPALPLSTLPDTGTKMLAWQIDDYGGIDRFKLVEKPVPIITKPDQVLIKVHASSINPIDIRMRGGYGARLFNRARGVSKAGDELPLTLGRDCSGIVVDMGRLVKGIDIGQAVWANVHAASQGSHAQYVLVTKNDLSRKPENLSHVEAASINYAAITTWSAVYAVAKIRPENATDKRVLILGGSGGIGSFAIQLMKAWGAHVTTTCSASATEFVSKLKPHHIVDYKRADVESELKRIGPFDFILDTVGGDTERYAMKALNKGSQYVTLVSPLMLETDKHGLVRGSLSSSWVLFNKNMQANKYGGKYRWSFAHPSTYALNEVAKLVEHELIRPCVEKVFPFTELPDAFANIETRSARGKTVVNVVGQELKVPKSADFYMS
nr:reticulon-4-interacting protein 1, mitochondrial-like [Lytechinus pictus]